MLITAVCHYPGVYEKLNNKIDRKLPTHYWTIGSTWKNIWVDYYLTLSE